MVSYFQTEADRTLYPAQLEQLLINLYAYREILVRNNIQYCGMQNLVAFAVYPMLDYLGAFYDLPRFPEQPASCTLQFTLGAVQGSSVSIPAGTNIGTTDGLFIFTTTVLLVISAGALSGVVYATCTTYGDAANGYALGAVSVQLPALTPTMTVTNTTITANGAAEETDNHYRSRIQAAPNNLTTAGPSGSYRSLTLDVSPTIVDAQVVTPVPGTVQVYVLAGPATVPLGPPNNTGLPTAELLTAVNDALSAADVRPLCDTVLVSPVAEVDYQVSGSITLYANADYASVAAGINAAAQNLALSLAAAVQQDIILNQWITALSVAGVYNLDITLAAQLGGTSLTPASDGSFLLTSGQWANLTSFTPVIVFGTRLQPGS
jgi:phage-related baseplate assembly protein